MPRAKRTYSESGYSHIVTRGSSRQILFEDDMDYKVFVRYMYEFSKNTNIKIICFALMPNHVHILIKDNDALVSQFMHVLLGWYATYYNKKYDSTGHLFENRYKYNAIEDDRYLLGAVRYILQNPLKAGLTRKLDYKWSSYSSYFNPDSFVDTEIIENFYPQPYDYINFLKCSELDYYFDLKTISKNDEYVRWLIKEKYRVSNAKQIKTLQRTKRDKIIKELIQNGMSVKQLSRLAGIPYGVIRGISNN